MLGTWQFLLRSCAGCEFSSRPLLLSRHGQRRQLHPSPRARSTGIAKNSDLLPKVSRGVISAIKQGRHHRTALDNRRQSILFPMRSSQVLATGGHTLRFQYHHRRNTIPGSLSAMGRCHISVLLPLTGGRVFQTLTTMALRKMHFTT